jgi:hypothetical protein
MNAARILVWVMSGMLIALLCVLVVGLSLGWHKQDPVKFSSAGGLEAHAFTSVNLSQPPGTIIEDVSEINGLAAITLSGGGIEARILFVDTLAGTVVGEVIVGTLGDEANSP